MLKTVVSLICLLLFYSSSANGADFHYDGKGPVYLDKSKVIIQDGDTIEYDFNNNHKIDRPDEIIRLIGFDAPELKQVWFNGDQEPYATRAKYRLMSIINTSKQLYIKKCNYTDKYLRILAHLYADNVPVAVIAVRERWGYETVSRYGIQGFPVESEMIMKATRNAKYPFEEPWVWRRKYSTGTPR